MNSILTSKQFWRIYFIYRLVVYFFVIFIYSKLTTLGDTARYLKGQGGTSNSWLTSSTAMMDFIGKILGNVTFHNMFLANFPFMILSFLIIKWAIEKTGLRKHMPSLLLLSLLCLPNFCIWTTVFSKEFVGLLICAIFGVLFYRYFNGCYRLKWYDYVAIYLCLLFKPQYLPFIFQGLLYVYISKKWLNGSSARTSLALSIFIANIVVIIAISPLINDLASMMYLHFNVNGTSTRPNLFLEDGDFFKHMPIGIIVAFIGPTIGEMMKSPLMLIAGVESIYMLLLFIWLSSKIIKRLFTCGKLSPIPFFSILLTTIGLLFIHYPFGIFNPGSAIRYRTNFLFLFIILLCYLYVYPNYNKLKNENCILR